MAETLLLVFDAFLCDVKLAVTATWINSCLFSERTEYLCEIEQYYSLNKRDGNLQRIDQKSWTIDLWSEHERDMSETCNGFYNSINKSSVISYMFYAKV